MRFFFFKIVYFSSLEVPFGSFVFGPGALISPVLGLQVCAALPGIWFFLYLLLPMFMPCSSDHTHKAVLSLCVLLSAVIWLLFMLTDNLHGSSHSAQFLQTSGNFYWVLDKMCSSMPAFVSL